MFRDLLHIDSIKHVAEEALNCWLTYAMAQPVNFNLAIIAFFIFQYTGFVHIKTIATEVKAALVRLPFRQN